MYYIFNTMQANKIAEIVAERTTGETWTINPYAGKVHGNKFAVAVSLGAELVSINMDYIQWLEDKGITLASIPQEEHPNWEHTPID